MENVVSLLCWLNEDLSCVDSRSAWGKGCAHPLSVSVSVSSSVYWPSVSSFPRAKMPHS